MNWDFEFSTRGERWPTAHLTLDQAENLARVYRWEGLPCRVSGGRVVVDTGEVGAVVVPHALGELLRGRVDTPIINDYRRGRIAVVAPGEGSGGDHFLECVGCKALSTGMALPLPVLDYYDGTHPDWFQRPHRDLCTVETLVGAIQLALLPVSRGPTDLLGGVGRGIRQYRN